MKTERLISIIIYLLNHEIVSVPFERMWFSLILGFGNKIKVLEPIELIELIKQNAESILSIY